MAKRRTAEGTCSAGATASGGGTGEAGPAERSRSGTVGVYDRPTWWRSRRAAIMIVAVLAASMLTMFFHLAAG